MILVAFATMGVFTVWFGNFMIRTIDIIYKPSVKQWIRTRPVDNYIETYEQKQLDIDEKYLKMIEDELKVLRAMKGKTGPDPEGKLKGKLKKGQTNEKTNDRKEPICQNPHEDEFHVCSNLPGKVVSQIDEANLDQKCENFQVGSNQLIDNEKQFIGETDLETKANNEFKLNQVSDIIDNGPIKSEANSGMNQIVNANIDQISDELFNLKDIDFLENEKFKKVYFQNYSYEICLADEMEFN